MKTISWKLLRAFAVIGFLASSESLAADPYAINVVLPLTGNASFLGKGEQESLQILEKSVNAAGGIDSRPLKFIFHDDQSTPQTAVQLATKIVAEKPTVILGSALVGMCNAMAPLMQNGPFMYCFSPGIHPKPGSFVYTSAVSTHDLASSLVRYFRMKGWTKLALITSTDASGQDAERGFKEVLSRSENAGIELVENAHFNPTDLSVSAQIEKIKAANPHALIAWSTGAPVGTVFKAIAQAGLTIPVGTTNGNMTYAQMTQYAALLPKQLFIPTSEWPEQDASVVMEPGVAAAHKRFHGAFKEAKILPDFSSTLAWEPAMIVVDALRTLGTKASAEELRGYVSKLSGYAGVNGIYDFTKVPQRGLTENQCVVTQWSTTKNTWVVVSGPKGVPTAQ